MPWPLAFSILLVSQARGAVVKPSAEVAQLLKKMRVAYSTLKSAHVTFQSHHFGNGTTITSTSECWYQAPNLVRVETKGIPGLTKPLYTLVSDGTQIHINGLPGRPMTLMYSIDQMATNSPQMNLEVLCLWDWKRQLSTDIGGNMRLSTFGIRSDTWNGKKWTVLRETARSANAVVDYYIDPATFLMSRTISSLINPRQTTIDVQVKKWAINVPVDPSLFKLAAK